MLDAGKILLSPARQMLIKLVTSKHVRARHSRNLIGREEEEENLRFNSAPTRALSAPRFTFNSLIALLAACFATPQKVLGEEAKNSKMERNSSWRTRIKKTFFLNVFRGALKEKQIAMIFFLFSLIFSSSPHFGLTFASCSQFNCWINN